MFIIDTVTSAASSVVDIFTPVVLAPEVYAIDSEENLAARKEAAQHNANCLVARVGAVLVGTLAATAAAVYLGNKIADNMEDPDSTMFDEF